MKAIQSQMSKTINLQVLHLEKKDMSLQEDGERLFIRAYGDRMKGSGLKLQEGRFRLDIWMKQLDLRNPEVFSILNGSVSLN